MTTITIDIPETQLAAIAAKAKAQGITLQDWFRQVAEREAAAAFKRLKSLFNILAETPGDLSGVGVSRHPAPIAFG